MSKRHVSIIEFHGFETEKDIQMFFESVLVGYQWGEGQFVKVSNLSEDGVEKFDECIELSAREREGLSKF